MADRCADLFRSSFLLPTVVEGIAEDRQPVELTVKALTRQSISLCCGARRSMRWASEIVLIIQQRACCREDASPDSETHPAARLVRRAAVSEVPLYD